MVSKIKVTARQLDWLFEYGPAVGWLDLNTLPAEVQKPAATFKPWLRLMVLFALRD